MANREMTLLEAAILALAALETPDDLTPIEREYVIESLAYVVKQEEDDGQDQED